MSDRNLIQRAAGIAVEFFEWIRDTLASDKARAAVLADLGLDAGATPPPLDIPDARLDSIDTYRERQDTDFQAFLSTWGDIVAVLEAIDAFFSAGGANTKEKIEEATFQLINLSATDFFRLRYPLIFLAARAGDVLVRRPENVERALGLLDANDGATLSNFTLVPLALLLALWDKTGRRVVRLFGADFELPEHLQLYGWDDEENSPTPNGDALSKRMLSFLITGTEKDPSTGGSGGGSVTGKIGSTMAWVPAEHGGPGLFMTLFGSGEVSAPLSTEWNLKVKFASTDAVDFLIWDRVTANGPSDASASVTVETSRKAEKGPTIVSVTSGTRLEIGKLSFAGSLGVADASIKAVASKSTLVLSMADADAFAERAIPAREVRFDFDFGLGVSSSKGVFLEGGSGLTLSLPLNRSIGPVRLRQLHLVLSGGAKGNNVRMEFLATLDVKLGPITATVDRLGFLVAGPTKDREPPTLDFQGPSGIGLVVDSEPVTGAGFLFADRDKGIYAGTMQLDIKGIVLSAVGIITTKMPDGSRGFSLLIIISAEGFTPRSLPFGFFLVGVGGLIGWNRTADVEALRVGLKNHSLDGVLFPENPVVNAPRIISALQTVMPAREDQYMAGLMGKFTWGVPTIITIDLGLVFEFKTPFRLLILGQIRALLPHEKLPLVQLQMDVLGVIDWDRDEVSIDAVLHDSNILTHELTGDMALRARWSNDPTFLLAVGGFNPGFSPPAGFPKLARAALTISRGENTRLRLEAYFALTSNTAQVGARIELLVRAGSFSVEGHLGFDALFQFSPFQFVVDIKAGITLKWHGRTLLGIDLELTLAGPSPWHAHGKATFKIWRFSKSVSFDRVCGAEDTPPALPTADPLPDLLAALADKRNWAAELPPAISTVLTFREQTATGEMLVHPGGELAVRQRVVPLGITIEKFGNTTPSGDTRFIIDVAPLNGSTPVVAPVLDFFAAAQFLELSDGSKLHRPSFEKMEAGVRIGGVVSFGGENDAALLGVVPVEYENVIPGVNDDAPDITPLESTDEELNLLTATAAYRSTARSAGRAKYRAPGHGLSLPKARYQVASTSDLTPVALPGLDGDAPSYTAAAQALWEHEQENPAQKGRLQIITVFVTEGADS
jgi:Family of unknown function (DUF6603)